MNREFSPREPARGGRLADNSERGTLGDAFDELHRICEEENYTLELPSR